jgi:hypothetical protein
MTKYYKISSFRECTETRKVKKGKGIPVPKGQSTLLVLVLARLVLVGRLV